MIAPSELYLRVFLHTALGGLPPLRRSAAHFPTECATYPAVPG